MQWGLAVEGWQEALENLGPTGKAKFERAISRLQIFRSTALSQYTNSASNVTDALQMAKLICAKGF
jgi:predicted DNA-binding protein (UPF0251 family)